MSDDFASALLSALNGTSHACYKFAEAMWLKSTLSEYSHSRRIDSQLEYLRTFQFSRGIYILKIYFRNILVLGKYFWVVTLLRWNIIFRTFWYSESIFRNRFAFGIILSQNFRLTLVSERHASLSALIFSARRDCRFCKRCTNHDTKAFVAWRFMPFVLRSDTRGIYRS